MIDKKKEIEGKKEGRGCGNTLGAFGEEVLDERGKEKEAWEERKEEAKGDGVNRCLIVICQSLNVMPL